MNLTTFLLLIPAAIVYLVPTFIAAQRRARNARVIFLVNLVFGWTVLFWLAALIWACVDAAGFAEGSVKKCPHCAEVIKIEAAVCRFCNRDLPKPAPVKAELSPDQLAARLNPGEDEFAKWQREQSSTPSLS